MTSIKSITDENYNSYKQVSYGVSLDYVFEWFCKLILSEKI